MVEYNMLQNGKSNKLEWEVIVLMFIKELYHVMCDVLFIPCFIEWFLPCLQSVLKHAEIIGTPSIFLQIVEDLVKMDPNIGFFVLECTSTFPVFHNVVQIFPFVKHF